MSVAPLKLKFQSIRRGRFRTCPFINKLRKILKVSLQALSTTARMTQLTASVIQFRNNINTTQASKKDTPNKTKTSGALFERKQKLAKLGNQQRAQVHFNLRHCQQHIKHPMSSISIISAINLNLA